MYIYNDIYIYIYYIILPTALFFFTGQTFWGNRNGGLLGGCLSRADRHRQGLAQEPEGETLVFQILAGLPSGYVIA